MNNIHHIINSYDIDGVIFLGKGIEGVFPGPADIIISGRSMEEVVETKKMLASKFITNKIYLNPLPFKDKTRESSGQHKADTILKLWSEGVHVRIHFEDDEVQAKVIRENCPNTTVVLLIHDLTEKENVRQLEF